MRSKKSKTPPPTFQLWKEGHGLSESELALFVSQALVGELQAPTVVFLEGELGAGKTTLARALLGALQVQGTILGSPTYPVMHEYRMRGGRAALHMDLYRVESEEELHERGIWEAFTECEGVVFVEWGGKFPGLELAAGLAKKAVWRVELSVGEHESVRDVRITQQLTP